MIKNIVVLVLAFILGFTAVSFAGNRPAVTYAAGQLITVGTPIAAMGVMPGKQGAVSHSFSVVSAKKSWNNACPVTGSPINSKHEVVVTLSNGKSAMVCCTPCKKDIDQNLEKYKAFLF